MTESPQPPKQPETEPEVRCPGCGRWNDSREKRCAHCGRPVNDRSSSRLARRDAEEVEALPPAEEPGPPPTPDPEWKRELSRRLEGYRQRQGEGEDPQKAWRAAAGRQTLPARRRVEDSRPPLPLRLPARHPPAPQPEQPASSRPRSLTPRPPAAEQPVAPLSLRALAGLLDLALVATALGVFVGVVYWLRPEALDGAGSVRLLGGSFFCLLVFYWIFFLKYLGRTPGMNWMGLRVLNFDCEPPTPTQRRNRAFGAVLSTAALGLGFAWAAADEQRFTWHDRMSKTFVALDEPDEF